MRIQLIGANPNPQVAGQEDLPGKVNYFIGNDSAKWQTNIPTFAKVQYQNVYPGVDLAYYGNQNELEYDFVVAPGADLSRIQFDVAGADNISVDRTGNLVISIARDQTGNRENDKTIADAITQVLVDQYPNDPNKTEPGVCGCGVSDVDSDGDGVLDCLDSCPSDPAKTAPSFCGCGVPDTDSDGDGTPDCTDQCPIDPTRTTPSAEVCNGADDNCNGQTDEGFNLGVTCTVGVGACQRTGVQVCTANSLGTQCNVTPGTPSIEVCGNNVDEDCDGADLACPPPPPVDVCTPTTVLDNFNRADGSIGNNWRGVASTSFYCLAGNRLDIQAGGPIYWNPRAFGASQAAFVTLSTVAPKSPSQGVLLKVQSSNVPNAGAIAVVYDAAAKAVRVSTFRLGALAWTPYGNTPALFSNGDKLGACAKANGEVRVYKNDALVKTVTLSTADQKFFNAKGGKVGVWSVLAPQAFLDDFGGATVVP